jgi:hypothetical protein
VKSSVAWKAHSGETIASQGCRAARQQQVHQGGHSDGSELAGCRLPLTAQGPRRTVKPSVAYSATRDPERSDQDGFLRFASLQPPCKRPKQTRRTCSEVGRHALTERRDEVVTRQNEFIQAGTVRDLSPLVRSNPGEAPLPRVQQVILQQRILQ